MRIAFVWLVLGAAIGLTAVGQTLADDWPAWRGPRGDGTSSEKKLPLRWSANDNIAWKTPIPGTGHSSPIVVGDRVFVTSCLLKEQQRLLLALDRRDGRVLWKKLVITAPLEPKHGLNSYASSTPACDGKRVYVSFERLRKRLPSDDYPRKPRETGHIPQDTVAEMAVACYSCDSELLWQHVPGQFYSRHGFCSPPILYKDLVILNGDQDAEAYLVALDKQMGEERWRIDRPNRTRSYCPPLILQAAGKTQMVLTGSLGIDSYDPGTGKAIWNINGPTEQYVASMVIGDGLLFMTAGFPTYHNMAIRPDGTGDVTETHIAWHENKTIPRKASYVPSPIAFDKWFYVMSDAGYINCLEAKTGKRLWIEQLGRHHSASPVLADGHIYVTDDDGVTYVLKAGPKFEVVSQNALGESCYASPAISGGQIFLRTSEHLWCIGKQ